jgi:hypothetical protein
VLRGQFIALSTCTTREQLKISDLPVPVPRMKNKSKFNPKEVKRRVEINYKTGKM